jgi:hypothetical protein
MGNPVSRFILSNPTVGTKTISEPIGWKDAVLKLERHPDYHSLIEYFEGSFVFYGNNGIDDGGIDFILNVENRFGPDAEINIVIDISFDDGVDFENVFSGQLNLLQKQHLKDNKIEVPIVRNDLWTKFIARKDIPVDLRSTTDLDGKPISVIDFTDLNLPSQLIRKKFSGENDPGTLISEVSARWDIPGNQYGVVDFPITILDEIEDKFSYVQIDSPTLPFPLLTVKYSGTLTINVKICLYSIIDLSYAEAATSLQLKINNDTAIILNRADIGSPGVDARTEYTYTGTFNLKEKDSVYLYIKNTSGSTITAIQPGKNIFRSFLELTQDTGYPSSFAQTFLIHDAAQAIIGRMVSSYNKFYSEFFGSTLTNGRAYSADGCGWKYVLLQAFKSEDINSTEKIFSMSFKSFWNSANAIFNLSLTYDVIDGVEVIRIEPLEQVFNASISVNISDVREIMAEYDNASIFNKIEIGYNKWQSEDVSGIDDPQTKHTYSTRYEKSIITDKETPGGEIKLLSNFIAASLCIEVTRRQSIKQSVDYKYDNEIFIIAINADDVSPDRYMPELNENFTTITNLFNSNTRYNLRLTPARNLLRWINHLNGCLQKYLTSTYKFNSAEGNYAMTSTMTADGCDGDNNGVLLSEKQNISPTTNYIHLPDIYSVEIDLSWDDYKTIRSNRNKAIGISQTETNFQ